MQSMKPDRLALLSVLFVTALMNAFAVAAADADKAPTRNDAASLPAPAGSPPFIVHNPNGTITVQKAGDAKAGKGLAIPPQVIVPVFSPPTR